MTIRTPFDVLDDVDHDTSKAKELLEEWDQWTHGGSPSGMAAAAFYAGSLIEDGEPERWTQDEICGLFDVSLPTIRQYYREMLEAVDETDAISKRAHL